MTSSIRIDRDVSMEMRDGTILRADIYRLDDAEKHPAILVRTPYGKSRDFPNLFDKVLAGYTMVIQDVRGRFASEGKFQAEGEALTTGKPDGYDSVEWIANQQWCDGNVGMTGGSALGGAQWTTAMENPPHLKAIAPSIAGHGPRIQRSGGVIGLSGVIGNTPMMAADIANRLEKAGKDVAEMRRIIEWAINNPEEVYNFLPLKDLPIAQFEGMGEMWKTRLQPGLESDEEKHWRYEKIMVPCFHVEGWYDFVEWGTFENFKKMREGGGSQIARLGQYLVVGPWPHNTTLEALGDFNFGALAGQPQPSINEQQLAFFDKYLRGRDIKIPIVKYFLMGMNQWKEADDWPLPETTWHRYYLHSQGNANTSIGDGLLSRTEPNTESPDRFIYDPQRPVPTVGGRVRAVAGVVAGPIDQSHIEKRRDILCYTTAELKDDIEITGPFEVHIFAATSAKDTDFTAKLCDVYPNGQSYNLAEGIKRARGLKSPDHPELINPNQVYEYVISMGESSRLFRKGHRIRIDISSSNFPQWDRNMNTGNPIGEDTKGIPAMQTIYHQSEFASYIDLPVIPK